jgi:hypothetical protein
MTAFETPPVIRACGPGCPVCADVRRAAVALVGSLGLAGVTPERLAQVAGLPAEALAAHRCGEVDACVAAAYREAVEGMQSRFAARLRSAATREDGLRDATEDLLAYLARNSDLAALVAVEVLNGGRELLELRERLRRRSVENVRRELARLDGTAAPPAVQVEMLVATIGHAIARQVTTGQTALLPEMLEPALTLVHACEPLAAG